jgi:uncharacterized membrane protein
MSPLSQPTSGNDELGPIDFLAIEFPSAHVTAPGFEQLLSLADQGVIDILDLEFITKDTAGNARVVDVRELSLANAVDLSAWAGASSGLLDDSDLREVAAAIQPGSAAAVIVYENRWVLRLLDAWEREGARLIADGGIAASDLVAALDATEHSYTERSFKES